MFTGVITRNTLQPARAGADRPALSLEDDETWTYAELSAQTNEHANALLSLDVQSGDRIGIMLYNSLEYWALYLGITRIGAVAVRVNWRLSPEEVRYVVEDSGMSILCVHDVLLDRVQSLGAVPDLEHTVVFTYDDENDGACDDLSSAVSYRSLSGVSSAEPDCPLPGDNDACMIMYTSGTTGRPKGALWTHSNTLWFGAMQALHWQYNGSEVHLSTTPMYHVSGFEDWVLPLLMSGGHAVIMRSVGLSTNRVVEVLQRRKCSDVFLVPALIYDWMSSDPLREASLPHLNRIITGGSAIRQWAIQAVRETLPHVRLEQAYGLTEGGGMCTALESDALGNHPGSVGKPLPLTEARIASQMDESVDAPPGADGELWVRSPSVCVGYYGNQDATEKTFVNGWCKTGDVARMTPDGYIYIVDRTKDMIISGGENIYPAEVETIVAEHPDVEDVAVIGVPDAKYDETPLAIVVRRSGSSINANEVVGYCRSYLARYKRPRYVAFADSLPRNASGKVLKRELRDAYLDLVETGKVPAVA